MRKAGRKMAQILARKVSRRPQKPVSLNTPEGMERFQKTIDKTLTQEEAFQILQATGLYDENGHLKEEYR